MKRGRWRRREDNEEKKDLSQLPWEHKGVQQVKQIEQRKSIKKSEVKKKTCPSYRGNTKECSRSKEYSR